MAAKDDFEEQASGWMAIFWNDNGNVSVHKVVFATLKQGKEWAKAYFERQGYKSKVLAKEVTAVCSSEMGYRFYPVLVADEATQGADISDDHLQTIR